MLFLVQCILRKNIFDDTNIFIIQITTISWISDSFIAFETLGRYCVEKIIALSSILSIKCDRVVLTTKKDEGFLKFCWGKGFCLKFNTLVVIVSVNCRTLWVNKNKAIGSLQIIKTNQFKILTERAGIKILGQLDVCSIKFLCMVAKIPWVQHETIWKIINQSNFTLIDVISEKTPIVRENRTT